MTETWPLSLAIFDFVPVLTFIIGAVYLTRLVQRQSGRRAAQWVATGGAFVTLGGTLKAVWKLCYTLQWGDFRLLSEVQFVFGAAGFLLMLLGVIRFARPAAALPGLAAMAAWKIPFLAVMTLCSMGVQGILTYVAFRQGQRLAALGFIVAFLCLVGMGGMSSAEQNLSAQWIAQSINTAGQLGFALGSFLLHRQAAAGGSAPRQSA